MLRQIKRIALFEAIRENILFIVCVFINIALIIAIATRIRGHIAFGGEYILSLLLVILLINQIHDCYKENIIIIKNFANEIAKRR